MNPQLLILMGTFRTSCVNSTVFNSSLPGCRELWTFCMLYVVSVKNFILMYFELTEIDILVTIPLGIVSDRGHRRLVLCINVCGLSAVYLRIVLVGYLRTVFPVKAMIICPLFSLLGGADCVFMSTVAAIVTEIAPEESRR